MISVRCNVNLAGNSPHDPAISAGDVIRVNESDERVQRYLKAGLFTSLESPAPVKPRRGKKHPENAGDGSPGAESAGE